MTFNKTLHKFRSESFIQVVKRTKSISSAYLFFVINSSVQSADIVNSLPKLKL